MAALPYKRKWNLCYEHLPHSIQHNMACAAFLLCKGRWKRAGWENLDSGVIGVSACQRPRWQPNRREHEQTTAPEPHPGIQGEGGTGCRQGRADAGRIGAAI